MVVAILGLARVDIIEDDLGSIFYIHGRASLIHYRMYKLVIGPLRLMEIILLIPNMVDVK